MKKHLSGLTVLVTRPEYQSLPLKKMIEGEGGDCIVRPTLDIFPLQDNTVLQALPEHVQHADKIIFITANAVICFFKHIKNIPENKTLYAMGPGTRSILKNYVKNNIIIPAPPYSTESFLILNDFQNITQQTILILSGEGGRKLLQQTLHERGAKVIKAEVYRRQCPNVDLSQEILAWQHHVDLIVSTSIESLKNLLKLVGRTHQSWLINIPLIVISERVAQAAHHLGFHNTIITAENASNKGILKSILSWYADKPKV